jgi:hypothetical protein
MTRVIDFPVGQREDSPSEGSDLGGIMSRPFDRSATSSGSGSPDALSAEALRALRQRLASGFYESEDVVEVIAEAVRREMDGDQAPS